MPTSPASAAPTWGAGTRAVHAGRSTCPTTGAILTPIHQTATYVQAAVGQHQGYTYSRCANPTITALEGALADLSSAPGSPPPQALAFKTGLAAITTLFLATLAAGDHVVCGRVVYGGTVRLLRDILAGFGVEVTFVDATDVTEVRSAVQDNTKLLFVETPANPTLEVCDLAELEGVARAAGALFAVDNTFLTGHLQSVLGGEGAACPADVEVLSRATTRPPAARSSRTTQCSSRGSSSCAVRPARSRRPSTPG